MNFYQGLLFLHGHIADPRVLTGTTAERDARAKPHRIVADGKRKAPAARKAPSRGAPRAA